MNNKFKFLKNTVIIALAVFSFSCGDEFTEEDALNAQQTADLAIYVYDYSLSGESPIDSAIVTINQAGIETVATSDTNGVALFPGLSIGSYIYKIEAANYITINQTSSISTSNFRVSQFTERVGLISTSDESTATIKGKIYIDSDLTNDTKEGAADIKLMFDVYLNTETKTYTAQTDADGNYELVIPTNGLTSGTSIGLYYPDLELNQTIAVNKLGSETGSFPEVLPRIETMETIFATTTTGSNNSGFSTNVRSLYGIADAAPTDGTTAEISSVSVNSDGEVTGVIFNTGGDYTGDTDGIVNIQIVSLDGGSDASIEVNLGDQTNLSSAYNQFGTATRTITAGSGYPSSNYSLNKTGYRAPDFSSSVYLYAGDVRVINGDYGTGVNRPEDVNN